MVKEGGGIMANRAQWRLIQPSGQGGIFSADIDWDAVADGNLGEAAQPEPNYGAGLEDFYGMETPPTPAQTPTPPTPITTTPPRGITGEFQPEYVEEETYMPDVVIPDVAPSTETPAPATEDFSTLPEDTDAYQLMESLLAAYDLPLSLMSNIQQYIRDGLTTTQMMDELERTPEYDARFPALGMLRDRNMNVISVDTYIQLENQYRNVMAEWGMPEGLYDTPDDFTALIANDVSRDELYDRVQLAANAVAGVDPELKSQLQILYGIGGEDDGDLIAYFVDPERAVPYFEQQLQLKSAGLSSAAFQSTGQGLSRTAAQRLAERNEITKQQISAVLSPRAGLTQSTLRNEGLTTSDLALGTFGLDMESGAKIKRLRERRRATRQAATGSLVGERGVAGLGVASGQIDS